MYTLYMLHMSIEIDCTVHVICCVEILQYVHKIAISGTIITISLDRAYILLPYIITISIHMYVHVRMSKSAIELSTVAGLTVHTQ